MAAVMDSNSKAGERETGWVNRLFTKEGYTPEYQELKFTLHRKLLDRINLEALSSMASERVRAEIRAHGMMPTPMGFNSFDYDRPGTQKIIDWVLKNSYSKQVILMHDGFAKREQTVAALPVIIEGVQKKGLGFSTICA